MRKTGAKAAIIIAVLFLISFSCQTALAATSVPESVMNARGGVVRILTKTADGEYTGSGFIVNSNGIPQVVTNHHVIAGAYEITVYVSTQVFSATVVLDNEEKDLCVLDVRGLRNSEA
jgi:S1-C subfamily serine protease